MKNNADIQRHVSAGLLAAGTAAVVASLGDAALAVGWKSATWSASAWAGALAVGWLVALVPGIWLGLVMASITRAWAPFDLLAACRGLLEVRSRAEETVRVSRALCGVLHVAGWFAVATATARAVAERVVQPNLEALAVVGSGAVLAAVAWGSYRACALVVETLLHARTRLLPRQTGLCSLPMVLVVGALLGTAALWLTHARWQDIWYRLDVTVPWWALCAGVGALVTLLLLGTHRGEQVASSLSHWAALLGWSGAALLLGGAALRAVQQDDSLREKLVAQHAQAAWCLSPWLQELPTPEEDTVPMPVGMEEEEDAPADDEPENTADVPSDVVDEPQAPQGDVLDAGPNQTADAAVEMPTLPPGVPRPNILFVTMDTVRADVMGTYGYTAHPTTPNVDAWAQGGWRFNNAYSGGPCSSASFMATITSRLPSRIRGLGLEGDVFTLPRRVTTLAQRLARGGYHTQALMPVIGDYLVGLERGFARFDGAFRYADVLATRAVQTLEELRQQKKPWFLWVHFVDAHHPYEGHRAFKKFGRSPRDLYAQEVAFMDHHVGRVLEKVTGPEAEDQTLVVMFSDHGEAFGEHGTNLHGNTLYNEEIHVPLLMRGAGLGSGVVMANVSLMDVGPTVVERAGLRWKGPKQGRSMLPLFKGEPAQPRVVWSEGCKPGTMLSRMDARKLMYRQKSGLYFLFDLAADPAELRNILADEPTADALKKMMRRALRGR